jgi:hypothetical protein
MTDTTATTNSKEEEQEYYEPADYVKYWFVPVPILRAVCWIFGHDYLYSETKKYCTRCAKFIANNKGESNG